MIQDDLYTSLLILGLLLAFLSWRKLRRPPPPGPPPSVPHRLGFSSKRAEGHGRLDAIVIGSGPAGLSTAAMLARRGKTVLVLEANEALGGGLHTWEDGGCSFETGFHYLGEVHCASGPLRRIIDYVAPGVNWAAMADCPVSPGVYDEVTICGERPIFLSLRPGEGAWLSEFIRAFPHEDGAIRTFLSLCKQSAGGFLPGVIWRSISSPTLSHWLKGWMTSGQRIFQGSTVLETMGSLTSDSSLVGALSYIMLGCCGVGPSQAAFAALAGVTCHFLQGGAYPFGGAASLVASLVHTIESAGGGAYVRAPVESIILDHTGRAVGVKMKRNGLEVHAPVVVSSIGAQMTLQELLPSPAPESLPALAATQVRQFKALRGAASVGVQAMGRAALRSLAAVRTR